MSFLGLEIQGHGVCLCLCKWGDRLGLAGMCTFLVDFWEAEREGGVGWSGADLIHSKHCWVGARLFCV